MIKKRSNSLSGDDVEKVSLKRHSVDSTSSTITEEVEESEESPWKQRIMSIYDEHSSETVVAKLVDCFFEHRIGRILAQEAAEDIKRTLSADMQRTQLPRVTYAISRNRWDTSVQVDRSVLAMLEERRKEQSIEMDGASFVKVRDSGWVYLSTLCTQEYANKFFGYSSYY